MIAVASRRPDEHFAKYFAQNAMTEPLFRWAKLSFYILQQVEDLARGLLRRSLGLIDQLGIA
jgi:hypothetical protein